MDPDAVLDELDPDPDGLLGAYVGTCDSGDCDMITSAVVWCDEPEDEGRWLSMCAGHAIKELARPWLPE